MASAVNIVLNAIDNYSSTLTGLNQGIELVKKAFNAVSAAAELAYNTIGEGFELAKTGGAFQEQRNQFENLARSYGVVGQEIINTVKKTSANTISEFDSIAIATKAVAAGLKGKELDDALSYVKRWSEATGQSFQSAAESVFTSLSSGRYSILRQMGLVIENGSNLTEVTKAMSDGLKRFGDTGFNTADKMDALTASQDDFWRKVGQGINSAEGFQKILGNVSDTVVELINNFDPTPVTAFVNLLTDAAFSIATSFLDAFPGVKEAIDFVLSDSSGAIKAFSVEATNTVFDLVDKIASGINTVIDLITGLNVGNVFSKAAQSATLIFGGLFKFITAGVSGLVDFVLKGFDNLFLGIAEIADAFPAISKALGVTGNDIRGFSDSIDSIRSGVVGAADGVADFVFEASKSAAVLADDFNSSAKKMKVNLDSIDEARAKAIKGLTEIKTPPVIQDVEIIPRIDLVEQKRAEIEAKKTAKEQQKTIEKNLKEQEKAAKLAAKEAEKAAKEAAKNIKKTIDGAGVVKASFDKGDVEEQAEKTKKDIEKKYTGFKIPLTFGAIDVLEKSLSDKRIDIGIGNIDEQIKGKIETEVKVKLDRDKDDKTEAQLPSDSQLLQWILNIVKNGLINEATGEGAPIVAFA